MKKVESLSIGYIGFASPETAEEVELTVLGLETVIAQAYQKVAVLKQGLKLITMTSAAKKELNAQTIETPDAAVK